MSALSGRDGWRCEYGDGSAGTGMGMWEMGIRSWAVLRYRDAPVLSSAGQGTGMSPPTPKPQMSSPTEVLPCYLFLPSRQISSRFGMSIRPSAQMLSMSCSPPPVPPLDGDALQHWDVPTPSTPGQGCPPALGCSPVPIAPQNRDILCYWDITVITQYRDILPVLGCSQDMDVPSSTEIPGAPARGWCPRGGGAQLTLVFCPRGWSHCCVT